MIVNRGLVEYLAAAVAALDANRLPAGATRTAQCPECMSLIRHPHDDGFDHIVWSGAAMGEEPTYRTTVVLVGCEGYYLIDPNLLGGGSGSFPGWQPADPPTQCPGCGVQLLPDGTVDALAEAHAEDPNGGEHYADCPLCTCHHTALPYPHVFDPARPCLTPDGGWDLATRDAS